MYVLRVDIWVQRRPVWGSGVAGGPKAEHTGEVREATFRMHHGKLIADLKSRVLCEPAQHVPALRPTSSTSIASFSDVL